MIGGAKTTISRNLDRVHLMGPRQEDLAKQPYSFTGWQGRQSKGQVCWCVCVCVCVTLGIKGNLKVWNRGLECASDVANEDASVAQ